MSTLGLIAGKGIYPRLVLDAARRKGLTIVMAAFEGETSVELAESADYHQWMRLGQLGVLIDYFKKQNVTQAMMAGQITPSRLFDLRPDFRTLMILATLKKRNAETLFGAVADELQKNGIVLLPATTHLEDSLAGVGLLAGPKPSRSFFSDLEIGWPVAKAISALDIGQSIVLKKGTILAVEGYDGTNATIRRGGELGKGAAVLIKVSKPRQDMRFDVPVIGPDTLKICAESGVSALVVESKKTLLLLPDEIRQLAQQFNLTLWGKDN
ncbi:MAG: UDP-2,3-diacylglucosamine diphosphatase LpxI [Blastochloris sp.]|nr:UDP-2,3-diacylglucosamine diphosphatase LpxI [Blastochloris sp.]